MGEITIHLPSDLEMSIENLVSSGVYKAKEEAVIALIRKGLMAPKKRERPAVYYVPEKEHPTPPFRPPEKWPDHYEFR